MLGRRLKEEHSDAQLLRVFAKGWRFPIKKIRTILKDQPIVMYIQKADEYQKKTLLA